MKKLSVIISAFVTFVGICCFSDVTRNTKWQDVPDETLVGTVVDLGGGGGGTFNYNLLDNKPKINGFELQGNVALTNIGAQAIISDYTSTNAAAQLVTNNVAAWAMMGQPKPSVGSITTESETRSGSGYSPMDVPVVGVSYTNATLKIESYKDTQARAVMITRGETVTAGTASPVVVTGVVAYVSDVNSAVSGVSNNVLAIASGYATDAAASATNALPAWTKTESKPTYTAAEVGARASDWNPIYLVSSEYSVPYPFSGSFFVGARAYDLRKTKFSREDLYAWAQLSLSGTQTGDTKPTLFTFDFATCDYVDYLYYFLATSGIVNVESVYAPGCRPWWAEAPIVGVTYSNATLKVESYKDSPARALMISHGSTVTSGTTTYFDTTNVIAYVDDVVAATNALQSEIEAHTPGNYAAVSNAAIAAKSTLDEKSSSWDAKADATNVVKLLGSSTIKKVSDGVSPSLKVQYDTHTTSAIGSSDTIKYASLNSGYIRASYSRDHWNPEETVNDTTTEEVTVAHSGKISYEKSVMVSEPYSETNTITELYFPTVAGGTLSGTIALRDDIESATNGLESVKHAAATFRDLTNNVCAADSFTAWSATLPSGYTFGDEQPVFNSTTEKWTWYVEGSSVAVDAESGASTASATSATFTFDDSGTKTFTATRARAALSNDTFTTYGFVTNAVSAAVPSDYLVSASICTNSGARSGQIELVITNSAGVVTRFAGGGGTDGQTVTNIVNTLTVNTNPAFSNAVLAVGLNIDTNSVAVLNEIASTFGGFPIAGTATTVGGLLAALAAAVAWLKKRAVKYDSTTQTYYFDI